MPAWNSGVEPFEIIVEDLIYRNSFTLSYSPEEIDARAFEKQNSDIPIMQIFDEIQSVSIQKPIHYLKNCLLVAKKYNVADYPIPEGMISQIETLLPHEHRYSIGFLNLSKFR